jgi:hypothetical protein
MLDIVRHNDEAGCTGGLTGGWVGDGVTWRIAGSGIIRFPKKTQIKRLFPNNNRVFDCAISAKWKKWFHPKPG